MAKTKKHPSAPAEFASDIKEASHAPLDAGAAQSPALDAAAQTPDAGDAGPDIPEDFGELPKGPVHPRDVEIERHIAGLQSEAGREWLRAELAKAQLEVERGPGLQGWRYNESLRLAVLERAAFLEAVLFFIAGAQ